LRLQAKAARSKSRRRLSLFILFPVYCSLSPFFNEAGKRQSKSLANPAVKSEYLNLINGRDFGGGLKELALIQHLL
jgi:hypothetical protein